MTRFIFFLLLVANVGFALHAWQSGAFDPPKANRHEQLAPEALKIIEAKTGKELVAQVEATKGELSKLAQSPCLLITGLLPTQIEAARTSANQLGLTTQLTERPLEQVTRYWVYIPKPANDKARLDVIALLKKQKVDYSPMADGDISLGLFAAEDSASRLLKDVLAKNISMAKSAAKTKEVREYQWLLRSPSDDSINKLSTIKRDVPALTMRAEKCEFFG
jgi:hypothetical protein